MMIRNLVVALVLTSVFCVSSVSAEEKKRRFTGSLSTTREGGSQGIAVGTAGDPLKEDDYERNPLSGSVSKVGPREWRAVIVNNSEDSVRAGFRVDQFDDRGKKVGSDSFARTLKGGESYSRTIRAKASTKSANLEVTDSKVLGGKKKSES